MKIHNLMEDIVKETVDKMYEQLKSTNARWLTCSCENCRLDVTSYVLNRIPPKYIVSGRGATHAVNDLNMSQVKIDVDKLVLDGIRLISSSKRPNHNLSYISEAEKLSGSSPYFYFPIFTGSVYDGTNFEPIMGAKIELYFKNQLAAMLDQTWQNPSISCRSTDGVFSFCVNPEKAEAEKIDGHFDFELKISAEGYESINYVFSIPVQSKILTGSTVTSNYSLKIQDLFMFPSGMENPME